MILMWNSRDFFVRNFPIFSEFCCLLFPRYLKTEHYETAEILKELWGVLFGQDEVENLIIMPSNIVIDFSFNELLEQHIKTKKLMTILANEIDTSKPNLNGYILSKDGSKNKNE